MVVSATAHHVKKYPILGSANVSNASVLLRCDSRVMGEKQGEAILAVAGG